MVRRGGDAKTFVGPHREEARAVEDVIAGGSGGELQGLFDLQVYSGDRAVPLVEARLGFDDRLRHLPVVAFARLARTCLDARAPPPAGKHRLMVFSAFQ